MILLYKRQPNKKRFKTSKKHRQLITSSVLDKERALVDKKK